MIGRQINFFLTAEDQAQLLTNLNAALGCALIKRDSDSKPYFLAQDFSKEDEDWAVAYLCETVRSDKILKEIASGKSDASELCAIEFIQPMQEGKVLRRGRFWYTSKYHLGRGFIQKPESFADWAEQVFRLTRRELVRQNNGDLIGSDALALQEASKIRCETS